MVKVRERQSRTSRQAWRARVVAAGPGERELGVLAAFAGVKHGLAWRLFAVDGHHGWPLLYCKQ